MCGGRFLFFFFFQAEDGIRDKLVTGVQTCALPIYNARVYQSWMRLGPDDVILGVAPLFHITGMIGHLAAAAQAEIPVILFYRFDVEEALRLTERWRATFTGGAITVFIAMANHPDGARRHLTSPRPA